MSFEDYLENKQLSLSTIRSYQKSLDRFEDWANSEQLEMEMIEYNDLMLFLKHCQQRKIKQTTISSYLKAVSHYFDFLLIEGKVARNPAADIELKGVKRSYLYHILEPVELHKLHNDYPSDLERDKRNKAMLGLLVYQGLRTEELGRLTVADVQLGEGEIEIAGSRKTNGRNLKLESHQVLDLYDYILQDRSALLSRPPKRRSQSRVETDLLFIGEGGNRSSISNFVTQLMLKVREGNPIVKNAKHLRTSVITKWLQIYNLRKVQYLAGHRYISSTERYLQNEMEGLKEEVDRFHPLQ